MSEELIKLENLVKEKDIQLDFYKREIERLHSIIKEVREYIENNMEKQYGFNYEYELNENEIKELLEILDKENKDERYQRN